MNRNRKSLVIIICVGLTTFVFIPTVLGLLTSSRTLIGSSVLLGALTYLFFVNWFIEK